MTDYKISPALLQVLMMKIAFFSSSHLGDDFYFLKEAVDLLIQIIGEENVIKELQNSKSESLQRIGNEWNEPKGMKRKLRTLGRIVEETKESYDFLRQKDFSEKTEKYKNFVDRAEQLSIIRPELFSLFYFMIEKTPLAQMSIPREYHKMLEQKGRKNITDLEKNRLGGERKQNV